jgi:hypothetical protein
MKVAKALLVVLFVIFLTACMSASQGPTPSAKATVDASDNTVRVIQKPVSAADNTKKGKNILGFSWKSTAPEIVMLEVGTQGNYVKAVHFDIDGNTIQNNTPESTLTEYAVWSYGTFKMPLAQFRTMANAKVVKMKVIYGTNSYRVTSFGKTKGNAMVDSKFPPFLEQVDAHLKKLKK